MNPRQLEEEIAAIRTLAARGIPLTIEQAMLATYRREACRTPGFRGTYILEMGSVLIDSTIVIVVCPQGAKQLHIPNIPRRAILGPTSESLNFQHGSRLVLRNECLMVCASHCVEKTQRECELWNGNLDVPMDRNAFRYFSCPEELALICSLEEDLVVFQ